MQYYYRVGKKLPKSMQLIVELEILKGSLMERAIIHFTISIKLSTLIWTSPYLFNIVRVLWGLRRLGISGFCCTMYIYRYRRCHSGIRKADLILSKCATLFRHLLFILSGIPMAFANPACKTDTALSLFLGTVFSWDSRDSIAGQTWISY